MVAALLGVLFRSRAKHHVPIGRYMVHLKVRLTSSASSSLQVAILFFLLEHTRAASRHAKGTARRGTRRVDVSVVTGVMRVVSGRKTRVHQFRAGDGSGAGEKDERVYSCHAWL